MKKEHSILLVFDHAKIFVWPTIETNSDALNSIVVHKKELAKRKTVCDFILFTFTQTSLSDIIMAPNSWLVSRKSRLKKIISATAINNFSNENHFLRNINVAFDNYIFLRGKSSTEHFYFLFGIILWAWKFFCSCNFHYLISHNNYLNRALLILLIPFQVFQF